MNPAARRVTFLRPSSAPDPSGVHQKVRPGPHQQGRRPEGQARPAAGPKLVGNHQVEGAWGEGKCASLTRPRKPQNHLGEGKKTAGGGKGRLISSVPGHPVRVAIANKADRQLANRAKDLPKGVRHDAAVVLWNTRAQYARKVCWDVINLLMTAAVAAMGKKPWNVASRRQNPAVFAFKLWAHRDATFSGVGHFISLVKEFTTNCRLHALQGGPVPRDRFCRLFSARCFREIDVALRAHNRTKEQQDILVQLSYVGRALPKGRPDFEGIKAQEDHRKALSTPAEPLDEGRREYLRSFARDWANKHLRKWEPKVEFDPTSGACLEFSRKQGGMAEYLRSALHKAVGHHMVQLRSNPWNLSAQTAELIKKQNQSSQRPRSGLSVPFGTNIPPSDRETLTEWLSRPASVRARFILRGQAEGMPIDLETEVEMNALMAEGHKDHRGSDDIDLESLIHTYKRITSYPVVDDSLAMGAHGLLRDHLIRELQQLSATQTYPEASVLTISERGFKTRIVTKSPGCVVALGHHLRRWMAAGLRTDPSIREVLKGDHREAVESLFHGGPIDPGVARTEEDQLILSADLKAATDLIGRETYEAIVDGILSSDEGLNLPSWARFLYRLCIGPQRLIYPDLRKNALSQRGALMGLPTTWPLLCLANLAWWHHGRPLGKVPRVRICGDDLVAKARLREIEEYETWAKASGAVFSNRSKHMVLRGGGVFTEEVFFTTSNEPIAVEGPLLPVRIQGTDVGSRLVQFGDYLPTALVSSKARANQRYLAATAPRAAPPTITLPQEGRPQIRRNTFQRWSEAFPLRGLVGTMKSDLTGTEAPYWVSIGPAAEVMMSHRGPEARRRILAAFRSGHPDFYRFASQQGLSGLIHVPRQFGGFGIPRQSLWNDRPLRKTPGQAVVYAAAVALVDGSNVEMDLKVLSRPWQDTPFRNPLRTVAASAAEQILSTRYKVIKVKKDTQVPVGATIYPESVDELIERVMGCVSRDIFYTGNDPLMGEKQQHKNAATVARRLRARLAVQRRLVVRERGGWILKRMRAESRQRYEEELRTREHLAQAQFGIVVHEDRASGITGGPVLLPTAAFGMDTPSKGSVRLADPIHAPATGEKRRRARGEKRGMREVPRPEDIDVGLAAGSAAVTGQSKVTWATLLKRLKEKEDKRIAVLMPRGEGGISIPFSPHLPDRKSVV